MKANKSVSRTTEQASLNYREVAIFAALRLLPIAISFFITWLIVRLFNDTDAGNYFYAFTIIGVAAAVASLGVNQSMVRFLGAQGVTQRTNQLLSTAMYWNVALALVLIMALYLCMPFLAHQVLNKPQLLPILQAQLWAVVGFTLSSLFAYAFQGVSKPLLTLLFIGFGSNVIFLLLLLGHFLVTGHVAGIVSLSYLLSASAVLSCIIALFLWFKQAGAYWHFNAVSDAELWSSASPLWVSQIVGLLLKHGTLLITGGFLLSADIAKLSVVLRTSELLNLLLVAVTLFASPKYARLYAQGDVDGVFRLARSNVQFLFLCGGIGALLLIVFSDIILAMFGEAYRDAGVLLSVLVIGQAVYMVFASSAAILTMAGFEREVMYCSLVSGMISLFLTFLLVSHYALFGAALATSVALILSGVLFTVMLRYKMGRWIFS